MPGLRRVLTLVDPKDPRTERTLNEYETAAAELQRPTRAGHPGSHVERQDLERIFQSLRPGEVDGAFLLSTSLRLNHSALTIKLAKQARLPVQAHRKEWVEQGALFSYGIDLAPIGRAGARYVDSILKGTSPADLPVEEVPKIEFAINLKTAERLGIKVPQDMIIRGGRGLPVGRSNGVRSAAWKPPARPHRRLIWKYTAVVVALVAAAIVSVGLTELYFSYQDSKRALTRVERDKASSAATSIEQQMQEILRELEAVAQPTVARASRTGGATAGLPPASSSARSSSAS